MGNLKVRVIEVVLGALTTPQADNTLAESVGEYHSISFYGQVANLMVEMQMRTRDPYPVSERLYFNLF